MPNEIEYIALKEARALSKDGDETLKEIIYAKHPSATYEPQQWEFAIADERLAYYAGIGALTRRSVTSRARIVRLILSFESIIRRHGIVTFSTNPAYWTGRVSHNAAIHFVNTLREQALLSSHAQQVSKLPNAYDPSPELLEAIPGLPEGCREGKLISDKPWSPVDVRPATNVEDIPKMGPRSSEEEIQRKADDVIELNQWYQDNAHRIEGVDDLRFHRVYQHSLNWGGRFYGQFVGMEKAEREAIRIDGEETEEADLNGSFLSFYLLINGVRSLPDDPYQREGLARYDRKFMKAVLLRLFGRGAWWNARFPNEIHQQKVAFGYEQRLPSYREVRDEICETYPVLSDLSHFKPSVKIEMFESMALRAALGQLRTAGEVGLPIHDGIRVKRSILDETRQTFEEARDWVCMTRDLSDEQRAFDYSAF